MSLLTFLWLGCIPEDCAIPLLFLSPDNDTYAERGMSIPLFMWVDVTDWEEASE